jgi:peptidoglycan hydrolase-like protein with peptidoglycan-binding domain
MARLRGRPAIAVATVVAVAGAGLAAWLIARPAGPVTTAPAPSTRTTPIVRTTLVATQAVMARVTPTGQWTITAPGGASLHDVRSADAAADAAAGELADARAALTAARRVRDLTLTGDRAAVAAASNSAGRDAARRQLALDSATQGLAVAQASRAVTQTQAEARTAGASLDAAEARACTCGSTLTALAPLGATVDRGGTLYAVDGQPTVLLIGDTPAYRALRPGDHGPDVEQLQRNLTALGRQVAVSGTFDAATQAAVVAWQSGRGVPTSGVVRLGDVVFLPSPVLVAAQHVAVGGGIASGQPLLDLSSSDLVVTATLDPGVATHVHGGDTLAIRLPDASQATGRVDAVGAVATASGSGGSGGGASQGGEDSQGAGSFGVALVARPDDPARLAGLAGATISIDVTVATVTDVLAVPVDALVVLADGRPAVEVATGGTSRFVAVQPGVYDRTLVEVRGDGLSAGDLVVVPAS